MGSNEYYRILLKDGNMPFLDTVTCWFGSTSGDVQDVFQGKTGKLDVEEITIKCQVKNKRIAVRGIFFKDLEADFDVKIVATLYVARKHMFLPLRKAGLDVVASKAGETRLTPTGKPEQHLGNLLDEAEELGYKYDLTVNFEYFGDRHYISSFLQ